MLIESLLLYERKKNYHDIFQASFSFMLFQTTKAINPSEKLESFLCLTFN